MAKVPVCGGDIAAPLNSKPYALEDRLCGPAPPEYIADKPELMVGRCGVLLLLI